MLEEEERWSGAVQEEVKFFAVSSSQWNNLVGIKLFEFLSLFRIAKTAQICS